jgi:antitoxin ParD1/3/4
VLPQEFRNMTVEIPPEYQQFVQSVIARGGFQTEVQVVSEALRLLEERDRHVEALRREIQVGLDELERGEQTEYDDESLKGFFEQVKAEGRRALDDGSTGS